MSDLKTYFNEKEGLGVLSTADSSGVVNAAIYSRPHVMDDGTLAVIMNDHLSHDNVLSNPKAHYLFREKDAPGYKGVRLALTQLREEENTELLYELCRRCDDREEETTKKRFLVFFRVDSQRPLIG